MNINTQVDSKHLEKHIQTVLKNIIASIDAENGNGPECLKDSCWKVAAKALATLGDDCEEPVIVLLARANVLAHVVLCSADLQIICDSAAAGRQSGSYVQPTMVYQKDGIQVELEVVYFNTLSKSKQYLETLENCTPQSQLKR